MTAAVEIRDDGPRGISYPVATLSWPRHPDLFATRRYGSWLIATKTGLREPEALDVDPEDLQVLPAVRAFDKAQRDARAALKATADMAAA